jgi:hypothetical protein
VKHFDRDGVSMTLTSIASHINYDNKAKAVMWGKENSNKIQVGHIGVMLLQLLLNQVFPISKVDGNGVHLKLKLSVKRKMNGDESKTGLNWMKLDKRCYESNIIFSAT